MAQICVTVSSSQRFLQIITYHSTSEASRVCKCSLLLKSIVIVIAYPLIAIPSYPLDSGCLVPNWCEAVCCDDVFDLFQIQDSAGIRAGTSVRTSCKLTYAIWSAARRVRECKTSPILL
jgi:hypothetical protein